MKCQWISIEEQSVSRDDWDGWVITRSYGEIRFDDWRWFIRGNAEDLSKIKMTLSYEIKSIEHCETLNIYWNNKRSRNIYAVIYSWASGKLSAAMADINSG